jgi:hypothetical protein
MLFFRTIFSENLPKAFKTTKKTKTKDLNPEFKEFIGIRKWMYKVQNCATFVSFRDGLCRIINVVLQTIVFLADDYWVACTI